MQLQRFIFSATYDYTSSLSLQGIFFFYWTHHLSIGFSCSLLMSVDHCSKIFYAVILPHIIEISRNFSTSVKTKKYAESHLTCQELSHADQYFLFNHKICLMLPYVINILIKRFQRFFRCTPLCINHSFYDMLHNQA